MIFLCHTPILLLSDGGRGIGIPAAQPLDSYVVWLVGAGCCVEAGISRNACPQKMVE